MPDPVPSPTDDWPALWQHLLQARAASDAAAPSDGVISEYSAALLAVYQPLLEARRAIAGCVSSRAWVPWTVAQLGQSLDGCIATAAGDSYYVTGPQSLLHLHRLRALCDAVLVGAGTVAADDPQLTTRHVPGPNPVRVVLDPTVRLDGRARVLRDAAAPTLWLCDARHAAVARERLNGLDGGATEVLAVDALIDDADPARGPDPARVLAALAARGLRLVFVEGGGVTVSRFLAAGALDRLHLVIAPVLIGDGRRGLQGAGPARMADCLRPPAHRLSLGEDMLWDLDMRGSEAI